MKKYISEKGEAPKSERTNLIMGVFKFKADKKSFNIEVVSLLNIIFLFELFALTNSSITGPQATPPASQEWGHPIDSWM